MIKLFPCILFEKYIYIFSVGNVEIASSGNQHCANCIDTLLFPIVVECLSKFPQQFMLWYFTSSFTYWLFAYRKSRVTETAKMAEKDVVKDATAEENTVAKDIVVTKYKMAAEIVNGAVTA